MGGGASRLGGEASPSGLEASRLSDQRRELPSGRRDSFRDMRPPVWAGGLSSKQRASLLDGRPPVWTGASCLDGGPPVWAGGLPSARRASHLGWGLSSRLGPRVRVAGLLSGMGPPVSKGPPPILSCRTGRLPMEVLRLSRARETL